MPELEETDYVQAGGELDDLHVGPDQFPEAERKSAGDADGAGGRRFLMWKRRPT